ncbi:putative 16S rRNA methyltransferase RsmB F FtsJ like methyltransferase [Trypanosoma vivax]|uniref:SAM-dependent MTase RsmB/NOP-type domain-containing protein n=1 Tax=Trypanosoma vivax (strain Y486) TaxID=1055687 RepID=G0TSZ2_TRYVY|nr:hypothetical protein TRVL_06823 [Trypanosoma vivax]KAH8605357.1 putative 16S rRNA methyltransferase RsmB F FtsJ like methyltransferase [Trypanosoma vivax]CCC47072.1 conserved hypothetical protein [Trypanosoma vivax Y486]
MRRNQKRKGGYKRGRSANVWATDTRDARTLSNPSFEAYYRGNVVAEEEWESFMGALLRPLPMALRVHPSNPLADSVREHVFSSLSSSLPTVHIPFISRGMALQCTVSRGDLKRSCELKKLKKLIATLNDGGFITRQETVSMIPVQLLQVSQGHRVLDMCAAPGSKTSQILETLATSADDGVVVANDLNSSRLDVLLHNTGRSPNAHAHLVVTNYDAARFPLLSPEDKFDRVLCDVMCSGDGTLRKSMDMWPRWNTLNGADVHCAQVNVLSRGMMLCKKGGIVVYSTCSMNPVEDEAVVSECLARAKGSFRLIDPTPLLAGFETRPGQTGWHLLTKDLSQKLHTFSEAQVYMESQRGDRFPYHGSMFPNPELLAQQNIHYTRRVLPHLQDTGGFFVAAMECVDDYPDTKALAVSSPSAQSFVSCSEDLQRTVREALFLPDAFPTSQLYVRSESAREQKLYFASRAVGGLLPRLGPRVVHVGAKLFESYSKYSNSKLRFAIDGARTLARLLPSSFIVVVEAALLLELAGNGGTLSESCFHSPLPPQNNFLLSCSMAIVGTIYIAAERRGLPGHISVKLTEWQHSLARLTLGLPLVSDSVDGFASIAAEKADGEPTWAEEEEINKD